MPRLPATIETLKARIKLCLTDESPVEAQNTAERLAIAQAWVRTGHHYKANPLPQSEPKLRRAWPNQQACDAKPDTTTKP